MGNGHAPGTATGLGIAGAETAVAGFGVLRGRTAGLAVFFFAAFFLAGFLAGLFLPAVLLTAWRAADLRAAFRMVFFLRADVLPVVFFFATFFLALAMTTSV